MRSWRTASVALQSFASGLPLGLILFAITFIVLACARLMLARIERRIG